MDMPDWVTNAFSLTREISSKVALPIFLTTSATLFLPEAYAATLGLDQFRDAYRMIIGALLVLSAAALVTNCIWWIGKALRPWINGHIFVRRNKWALESLTTDEKQILRAFILNGQSSVSAEISDGVINMLVKKQVLFRASDVASYFTTFNYIMQPWAREYLTKRPHLLD